MRPKVHGIHHVTAIAADPQENVAFFTGTMGLRLVKKTVNQDATDTYHLFYADAVGTPGTDITFFPWPESGPGRPGIGLAMETAFAVPLKSLDYWRDRLRERGVAAGPIEERFGERAVPFRDPHGLPLALVETAGTRPFVPWDRSTVPAEHQLQGMYGVRLWERQEGPTAALLTQRLGFQTVGEEGGWKRFAVDGGGPGRTVEIRELPESHRGAWGTGSVHHVAWRVSDTEEQMALREEIDNAGLRPTPPIDRFWFRSVYFLEPGGVLFELATDGPGFARDETAEHLGETLVLPPWLEAQRERIEASLPPIRVPEEVPTRGARRSGRG